MFGRGSFTKPSIYALLVPALALGGMIFVQQCRAIHDTDIFWQVQAGELILANRGLIEKEPFAATHGDEPFVPVAWLGQVVFALVFRCGGWQLLYLFDSTIWAIGFLVVMLSVWRKGTRIEAVGVALALGFMASLPWASLRPQCFALLGYGLLIALSRSQGSTTGKMLLAIPLLVAWQNLHPSVSVVAAGSFGAAVFGWAKHLRNKESAKPWRETGLVILSSLATFATPMGSGIFKVSMKNATLSRELGVGEWMAIWSTGNRGVSYPIWLAVAATAFMLARRKTKVFAEDVGRAAALGLLMLTALRFAPFWALAMIPIWAGVQPAKESAASAPLRPRFSSPFAIATILGLGIGAALANLVRPRLFDNYVPFDGIAALKASSVTGCIYCFPPWGGALIEAGSPNWTVSYDGRYYVYSPREWHNFIEVSRGTIHVDSIEATYRPAAFVLSPLEQSSLIEQLRHKGTWFELYATPRCAVFIRRRPQ